MTIQVRGRLLEHIVKDPVGLQFRINPSGNVFAGNFDGINDVATTGVNLISDYGADVTVSFRARRNSNHIGVVFVDTSAVATTNSIGVNFTTTSLAAYSWDGGALIRSKTSTALPATGEWHHFAAILRSGTWEFYFNGVQAAVSSFDTPRYGAINSIQISDGTNTFDGGLSDLRIYDAAKSASEIASLATGVDITGNLVEQYNIDDGTGLILAARQSAANNMTVTGATEEEFWGGPKRSVAGTFQLPLIDDGVYDCNVEWGDGTSSNITAFDDAETLHTYTGQIGSHTITIRGACPRFAFANGGDKDKFTELIFFSPSRTGQLNCLEMFYGCSNLTSIDLSFFAVSGINVISLCRSSGLLSPPNIWKLLVNQNVSNIFRNCTSMVGTPNFVNYRGGACSSMFDGCSNLSGIIDFYGASNITNASFMFRNTGITGVKNLNHLTSVTNMASMFQSSQLAGNAPSLIGLSSLTNLNSAFNGANIVYASTIHGMSPSTHPVLVNFGNAFINNSSIIDDLPEWWVDFSGQATTTAGCFINCTNATNFADVPAAWK